MSLPSRRLVVTALLPALTGCGSLLPQPATPPRLYTLTAATDFPTGLPKVRAQLLVDTPAAQASLDSTRIALSRSPTSIDYFADAAWTDRAPLMVQSLIVESLENSGRITAIARESLALRADFILKPELRHFEAVYRNGAEAPTALVQINVKLIAMPDRTIVGQRTVEGTAVAARNEIAAIVEAFDAAFHQAARQIVDWTLGGLATAAAR
jgi:cholesterol transport system auxiliary component